MDECISSTLIVKLIDFHLGTLTRLFLCDLLMSRHHEQTSVLWKSLAFLVM